MAKYIPLDAVVAEIERLIERANAERVLHPKTILAAKNYLLIEDYNKLLSFLDTLEVKEVDLEEYYHDFLQKEWFGNSHVRTVSEMMAFTAKHFFELGLCSTITEEDCKLIWNIGDEIPNMPEEEFFKELLRRYKAQKGE